MQYIDTQMFLKQPQEVQDFFRHWYFEESIYSCKFYGKNSIPVLSRLALVRFLDNYSELSMKDTENIYSSPIEVYWTMCCEIIRDKLGLNKNK
ncbi:hypothetical protein D3C81_06940 [compost metagenome]